MRPQELKEKLKDNPRPVVIDIWAPWCAPCRVMQPALEKTARQYRQKVDLWKISADEYPGLVSELKVTGIPTLIAFRDGKEFTRRAGIQSGASLEAFFEGVHNGRPAAYAPAPLDRVLRAGSGLALAAIGWLNGPVVILLLAGGVLLFSAVYDRCPVWQALAPRLAGLWRRYVLRSGQDRAPSPDKKSSNRSRITRPDRGSG